MSSLKWTSYPNLRTLSFGCVINSIDPANEPDGSLDMQRSTYDLVNKEWFCPVIISDSFPTSQENVTITYDTYAGEIVQFIGDFNATKSGATNPQFLNDYFNTDFTVNSVQSGYIYQLNSPGANDFFGFDFLSITFDGNYNSDATFLLDYGDHFDLDCGSPSVSYINGAKKENVFIKFRASKTAHGSSGAVKNINLFGSIFIYNASDVYYDFELSFNKLQCTGPILCYGIKVRFYDSDVSIGYYPSTTLNDYNDLRNVNLFSDKNFVQVYTEAFVISTWYNDSSNNTVEWIQGTNYANFDGCSADLASFIDYIQNECVPFLSNTALDSTLLPISDGYSYITNTLSGTYTATGDSNSAFLIIFTGPELLSEILFETSGGASTSNIFIIVNGSILISYCNIKGCTIVTFDIGSQFESTGVISSTIIGNLFSTRDIDFTNDNYVSTEDPCFREGTLIETPFGKKKVECLRKHDLVYTTGKIENNLFHLYDARMAVPIRFVGRKTSVVNNEAAPVRIPQDLFEKGSPCEDLYISRNHGVLVHRELVPAYQLIETHSLKQCFKDRTVTYYHIELEQHSAVIANGVSCESYLDCGNRVSLHEVGRHIKTLSL
jgi:hypothetical protein